MVIICRDIWCFTLALVYLENWWVIFNIKCDFLSEWEEVTPTLSVFLYTSPFQFFFWVELKLCFLSENVNILLKNYLQRWCFMLALFYLENVMGDIQYKIWFSITVRGVPPTSVFFCTPPLFNYFLELN